MFKKTLFTLLLSVTLSTFQSNAQNSDKEWSELGKVENTTYYSEIPFRYIDGYIFIDIIQNGSKYNFLFDTGSEGTLVDKSIVNEFDYRPYSETKLSGPVVNDQEIKTIVLSKIQLSDIVFSDIGAIAIDLDFAKEKFCDKLHGIIGSNLMKKSNWQIDYKNQLIKLSDNISEFHLGDPEYVIETKLPSKGFGTETIDITINGITMPFDFDTGNGSSKIVANPKTYKKLIKKSNAVEYGFSKSDKDFYLIPEKLLIGGVEFSNQLVSLENRVGNLRLLGNRFYENFLVTVDWENHQLYLDSYGEIDNDDLFEFPLKFTANYNSNKVVVASGLSEFLKANKLKEGSVVSKVNGVEISNLSDKEFCEFWNSHWKDLMREEYIEITILKNGKQQEIVLKKDYLS
jgi:predicted aspartyl protease